MGSKFSVSRMRKELERQTMTSVVTSGDSTVGSGLILSDVGYSNSLEPDNRGTSPENLGIL